MYSSSIILIFSHGLTIYNSSIPRKREGLERRGVMDRKREEGEKERRLCGEGLQGMEIEREGMRNRNHPISFDMLNSSNCHLFCNMCLRVYKVIDLHGRK